MARTARLLCLVAGSTLAISGLGAHGGLDGAAQTGGTTARDRDRSPSAVARDAADPARAAVRLAAARDFVPRSFRFPAPEKDGGRAPAADREAAPPLGLTATDGTGLRLVALAADGVLVPPLAFTELRLTFENPRDAVMEGHFRIALPPGAAISRFAMKIGGAWQEAEVVERQLARQAYEDFLHRRQDPALLEQEAGNEFSARVFPILPRERKELIVSWSHALARSDEPYVLPLLGLPEIGRLDARVQLGARPAKDGAEDERGSIVLDRRTVELHQRDWKPDRDLVADQGFAGPSEARSPALRHGNLAVVRVAAPVAAEPQEIDGLFVLVDSSASRALGWEAQTARVAALLAGLRDGAGARTPLAVAAFDQEVEPLFEGTAGGFDAAAVARLRARRALGASDLAGALGWLGARLEAAGGLYPRVLLVTDGVATAGATDGRDLRAAVRALGARGVERLDVLAVGGLRDDAALRALVTGNLEHDGQRLDGGAPLAELARRLTLACRSGLALAVEGAEWTWPETLDGVQPGDETLVFADLPAGRPLRVTVDGEPLALAAAPVAAERALLQRAWAQARIDRLLHLRETELAGDGDLRRALVREVTDLSVQHRVLTPFTALLVLETEADYARYRLDRRALADILTVGPGGLDVLARRGIELPAIDGAARAKREAAVAAADSEAPLRVGDLDEEGGPVAETITVTSEPPSVDERAATASTVSASDLARIPTARDSAAVAGGVAGGVEGRVAGGVPGGVAGGLPGAPRRQRSAAPPPASVAAPRRDVAARLETAQPVEVPQGEPGAPEEIVAGDRDGGDRGEEQPGAAEPWSGRYAEVMLHLGAGRLDRAQALAEAWNAESPGDVLSLLALGEVREASGDERGAARAYGSLIDLFPSRADMRRLAGERLERLRGPALALAVDTYRKAVEQRPDHPTGHRLLAWALLRAGDHAEAFAALEAGIAREYPGGRFRGVERVLAEDLGLLAAAWLRAEPGRRAEMLERLEAHGARLADRPSLRFVLSWETDANDVDLHVHDRHGARAYYHAPALGSGGELYDDVTTGYGPECFTIPGRGTAAPYRLTAHYYSRGPMGYGMGILQVVEHDGRGGLRVDPRPFVVMSDGATVDLGTVGPTRVGK